jgi:hypothetical protein
MSLRKDLSGNNTTNQFSKMMGHSLKSPIGSQVPKKVGKKKLGVTSSNYRLAHLRSVPDLNIPLLQGSKYQPNQHMQMFNRKLEDNKDPRAS